MKDLFIESAYACHVPDRRMDAHLLSFNLPTLIDGLLNENAWITGDRNAITLYKNSNSTTVLIALREKSEVNFKQSGNHISIQVIKGKLNFKTELRSIDMNMGCLLSVHEDIKHNLVATDESVILLTVTNKTKNSV